MARQPGPRAKRGAGVHGRGAVHHACAGVAGEPRRALHRAAGGGEGQRCSCRLAFCASRCCLSVPPGSLWAHCRIFMRAGAATGFRENSGSAGLLRCTSVLKAWRWPGSHTCKGRCPPGRVGLGSSLLVIGWMKVSIKVALKVRLWRSALLKFACGAQQSFCKGANCGWYRVTIPEGEGTFQRHHPSYPDLWVYGC